MFVLRLPGAAGRRAAPDPWSTLWAVRRGAITILIAVLTALSPALARASTGPIVRFATSLGNIDVQLLANDAPNTVTNFLSYVNSGAYANTFFHRSVSKFVIQGGGYQVNSDGSITQIQTQAPIGPEIKDSNVRGTLAMALSGSPPDQHSATDQWFFNLADNSASLDPNFTVFGKVLDPPSLAVMDQIAAEPTSNNGTNCSSCPFSQLPLQNWSSGQQVTDANLIMTPITVLNDTTAPMISITTPAGGSEFDQDQVVLPDVTCNDGSGTGVASCTETAGTDASGNVDTTTLGSHTFTVTSTDYAGNSSTQSVTYDVVPAPALPVTPTRVPSPAPKLTGVPAGSSPGAIRFVLRCVAARRCSGRATLSYTAGKTHRAFTIGSTSYSIAPGGHATCTIHITRHTGATVRTAKPPVYLRLAPTGGKARSSRVRLRLSAGS